LDEATKKRIIKVSNRVSLSFNGNPATPLSYYDNKPSEKYPFLKRFGPELLLGVTLAEKNPSKEYLLIKRSQGGTALYGAWNPNWTTEKAREIEKGHKQNLPLFDIHINDIYRNLDSLKAQGKSYRIFGLAWMQGENDAIKEVAAKGYRNNLKKLMQTYRDTLNTPEMPFAVGQINSRYGVKGGAEMVRTGMYNAVSFDYYAQLIETSTNTSWNDFPKYTDNVHYNTEGQKRLGVSFANAFFAIEKRLNVEEFQDVNQLKPNNILKVKAKGETNMMYHVYTPTKITSGEKLPIIIAFSPNGKGLGMVTKMREVVEKYEWIVVGCDKLKNGMNNIDLEQRMEDEVLNDILENIPHNSDKIYLAGFSGGAMRAYSLTTRRPEKYDGIIAFGGWLGGNEYQDKAYQNGMYVAIVNGNNDKGANKWNEIDGKTLEKNDCIVKQFSFEGGHQVAPKETIQEVCDWLNNN